MFDFIREKISPQNLMLLIYHRVMAFLVSLLFGFPAKGMTVIAVTGTSGKTTTVSLIASILERHARETGSKEKIGVLSSAVMKTGSRTRENTTKITTFSRFTLNRLLREMKKNGCQTLVFEVTSHALSQFRLAGIPIDIAVLTNLSGDHLEYHGGFEPYKQAKMRLFQLLAKTRRKPGVKKVSILPADDPHAKDFAAFPADLKVSFGITEGIFPENLHFTPDGTDFDLRYGNEMISIHLKLVGKTHLLNSLAASAVAYALGIPKETVKLALEEISLIPGRYETVKCSSDQPFTIVVDYAHTPKALEALCSFYRDLTKGKLIVVFGSTGGGRDKAKRSVMGEVVSRYADIVVVTDDDPYTEDRQGIIDQVAAGVKNKKEGESLFRILGRREGIQKALSLVGKGDTVLIAGKGSEKIWIVGNKKIPWDDKQVAYEIIQQLPQV